MAVKKKTSKKNSRKAGLTEQIRRTSKKMVDKVLVQISPQLQEKIDHLIETLESSKNTRVGDLSLMASKILLRAQDISRSIHVAPQKPAKTKKTSKKS